MRGILFIPFLFGALAIQAQWDVPVKLVFDGTAPADRQITGLADPIAPDAAVGLDAARATALTFATAQGSAILLAQLVPAPVAYAAGMTVTVVPAVANLPGAQIDLNGLGPLPIVKWGNTPLDSADLRPGDAVRLLCDGARFHLIGHELIRCPTGFSPKGRAYCMEDSASAATTWFQAAAGCAARNARLCSFNEWVAACRTTPGFLGTITQEEWVDEAANHVNHAKLLGLGTTGDGTQPLNFDSPSCNHGWHELPTLERPYRCCSSR